MPWKKLLIWATGQIDKTLSRKLEFLLEKTVITAPCLTAIHLAGTSRMPSARGSLKKTNRSASRFTTS